MAPEKCPQKSEQMTQASGVSTGQVLRVHDTEPRGAGSFCSELCYVSTRVQQKLESSSWGWSCSSRLVSAGTWLQVGCVSGMHRGLSACPDPAAWLRSPGWSLPFALNKSFNLKLTCKSESLGIGEAFLLSVLNLNNLETCGQRFSPAKGRTNMKFSSSKASSEQAWLIPGGE